MLEKILKLYVTYMAGDVRSPLPHLFGPPGCGKSTSVEEAARLLGVNLHIINVSRLSPLETEGVQMPHGEGETMALRMLTATFWTQLKEGDILLLDEFLRGFPEVYNALLDILTSRRVGGFTLPKVFIIAASNTTVSYDKALEDRLLHLPVPDPRKDRGAKQMLATMIVEKLGLMPETVQSHEMSTLIDTEVLPMFECLDSLKNGSSSPSVSKGRSIRNLIGQAQLREVQSANLHEMLSINNDRAMRAGKPQFVLLPDGKNVHQQYVKMSRSMKRDKLTPIQVINLDVNHQLIALEAERSSKEDPDDAVF